MKNLKLIETEQSSIAHSHAAGDMWKDFIFCVERKEINLNVANEFTKYFHSNRKVKAYFTK